MTKNEGIKVPFAGSTHRASAAGGKGSPGSNSQKKAAVPELIGEAVAFRGSLGVSIQGREGFKDYMRTVRRAFPDFHNAIEELIAEGDQVVARLSYTGTHKGELFGIGATGRHVSYAGVAIFRIAEGRIAEGWVLGDVHSLVRQLRDG